MCSIILKRCDMNKTKNTTKRVRSATVFALVEGLIILLFMVLGAANLFFTNGTANRRTRQLVEDSYRGQIDNLTNDIRNVSLAGFSLMSNETVVRLKSYYFSNGFSADLTSVESACFKRRTKS